MVWQTWHLWGTLLMKTTTQTYNIRIEYADGNVEQFNRTMPTKPTTIKGQSAQNDRVCKWVEKYIGRREWKRHEIVPVWWLNLLLPLLF